MVNESGSVLFSVKHRGTPKTGGEKYRFKLGWRPVLVHAYKVTGSTPFDLEEAVVFDGPATNGLSSGDVAWRGGSRGSTDPEKYTGLGSGSFDIYDDGFQFGGHSWFRVSNAVFWFHVFRGTNFGFVMDLDDVQSYVAPFGSGKGYGVTTRKNAATGGIEVAQYNVPGRDIGVFEVA